MKKYKAVSSTFVIFAGVIFILIALSISTVIKNLSKTENSRRFKNIYSTYQTALLRTEKRLGGATGCYFSDDHSIAHDFSLCDDFYTEFMSNFKIKKYCEKDALQNGCIPQYKEYTTNTKCTGFFSYMMNKVDDVFVMEDDSILIVYKNADHQRRPIFAIDINGMGEPNRAGEDLFSLLIVRGSRGEYYFSGNIHYCLPVNKDGVKNVAEMYEL